MSSADQPIQTFTGAKYLDWLEREQVHKFVKLWLRTSFTNRQLQFVQKVWILWYQDVIGGMFRCGRNARVTKFRWNGTDQYTCSRLKPSLRNFVPIANPAWLWFLKRDWGRSGFQAFNSQLDFYHTRLYSDCLAKVCGRVSENGCWLLVHVVLKFAPIWFSYRILNRNDLFWGKK